MDVLSYSPKMELYVSSAGGYYDLTDDVVSASVTRNQDAVSTFNVRLANKHGKYNGVFSPMDRVTIYLSKFQRFQVLTGYIGKVNAWTLYSHDFEMSGYCSLYRLQRLFWDPGLKESVDAVRSVYSKNADAPDAGLAAVAAAMLVSVGGMAEDSIAIEADIPQVVKSWAYGLYAAKIEDMEQARDLANQFYEMLRTAGPQITSGNGGSGASVSIGSEDIRGVWDYLIGRGFSKAAAAAIMGVWQAESNIDPTSIEGIYDEPNTLGPKKKAAMADWEGYTLGVLFPKYAAQGLRISQSAYIGSDGKYYPGLGLAGYTGPRVNDLFNYAKAHGKEWYTFDANIGLFESELSTKYKSLLQNDFMKATDIPSAVSKFVLIYENPGGIPSSWLANRINNAKGMLDKFGK